MWGQRGCRKQALWERPPRCYQVPGEAMPSPSEGFFKSALGKSLRNLVWLYDQTEVGLWQLCRSFSTWNTSSSNAVTNYLSRFRFEFCLYNLTCMSKMLHAQSVLSKIQLMLVLCAFNVPLKKIKYGPLPSSHFKNNCYITSVICISALIIAYSFV